MTGQDEIDYCSRREREERLSALTCVPMACDAHLAMAERYADRAWGLTERLLDGGWAA